MESGTMATLLAKQDPCLSDAIRIRTGEMMRRIAPPKKWARALGKSERLMQARCAGEKPGGFSEATEELVAATIAGLEVGPVLTHFRVERQTAMTQMSEDELVTWLRGRMLGETQAQGPLDYLQMTFAPEKMADVDLVAYLADLEDKAKAQASLCDDIAVGAKLMRHAVERRMARNARRAS